VLSSLILGDREQFLRRPVKLLCLSQVGHILVASQQSLPSQFNMNTIEKKASMIGWIAWSSQKEDQNCLFFGEMLPGL
jgi:hypothetical protein